MFVPRKFSTKGKGSGRYSASFRNSGTWSSAKWTFYNKISRKKDDEISQTSSQAESNQKHINLFRFLEYFSALIVFAATVVGSVVSYNALKSAEYVNADNIFIDRAFDRAAVLQWELDRVLGDLDLVTAYMNLALNWKEDYFRGNFHNLTTVILDRSPECQSLQFSPMVATIAEREFLENQVNEQLNLVSTSVATQVRWGVQRSPI